MSTPYFHFRQFSITQDKAAMKISTDGVLLGAVCAFDGAKKVLDIGAGTGLISLMAAQQSNAEITAVETAPAIAVIAVPKAIPFAESFLILSTVVKPSHNLPSLVIPPVGILPPFAFDIVSAFAKKLNYKINSLIVSPIKGGDGNKEFLMYLDK